jgi:hypothetical protein
MTAVSPEFSGTDRFVVLRRLGAGGMGVVYEALDRERDVRVALKVLPHVDPPALLQFKQAFRSLAAIVHPNLVPLYELISDGDLWFFTMEIIHGSDFLSYLRSHHEDHCRTDVPSDAGAVAARGDLLETVGLDGNDGEPRVAGDGRTPEGGGSWQLRGVDQQRLRDAFSQLGRGVIAIHAGGSLHRDLKPTNVLVKKDGQVVILDFGLVLDLGGGPAPERQVVGTIQYMSPEQAACERLTPASDWYAVGVMLYEALTGRRPFSGDAATILLGKKSLSPVPPAALVRGIPWDLNRLCINLLQRDPRRRPTREEFFTLLAPGAAAEGSAPGVIRPVGEALFVGRERHLQLLADSFEQLVRRTPVTVQVHGRSGVGKSALVARFLEDVSRRQNVVVLSGRCYEQESVPYKAVDSLVDSLTRYLARLPKHLVADLIPPAVAALARVFPVLRRVEAIAGAPQEVLAVPDLRELRRRAFMALRELLARIGARTHLVLWIDDLQWGDVDSAALLMDLLRPPGPPCLLLLVSYRVEYVETSACLKALTEPPLGGRRWTEVSVEPLGPEDARALAWAVLRDRVPDAVADADRIAQESGGNPYFIYELAHVPATRDGPVRTSSSGALQLDDMLWHRVQQLPDAARRLLEVVAVAGQPLQVRSAYESVDLKELAHGPVALLRAERLVRSSGPGLTDDLEVYHDRIRETITAHLSPLVLKAHHGRLAHSLEASGDADAETLAMHFEQAEELERAGAHYAGAAHTAAKALAFAHAARLYRRSLDLRQVEGEERRELQVQLGHALTNAGRGHEAALAYRDGSKGAGAEQSIELRRLAATQFCISGHIDDGRRLFGDLLAQVGVRMPSSTLTILSALLVRRVRLRLRGLGFTERSASELPADDIRRIDVLWWCSAALSGVDVVGVAALQSQCLLLALEAGEPYRLVRSLAWEAVLTSTGGWAVAKRVDQLLRRARALAQRIDQPHAYGLVSLASGWSAFLQLRLKDALRDCGDAEEIFRERCTAVWWELGNTRTMTAWSLVHCGEVNALARIAPLHLTDARERGDLFTMMNLGAVAMPHLRLVADDPDGASNEVEQALALWPHQGFHIQHVSALFSRVNLELYRGDGLAAWQHIAEAWPTLRWSVQFRNQLARVMLRDLRGRSAIAAAETGRDQQQLLGIAEACARRIAREDAPWAKPFAARVLAGVAAARGHLEEAAADLERAMTGFEAFDLKLHAAACRRRLGQLVAGDRGAALIEEAERCMRDEQVRNISRMTAMYVSALGTSD